MLAINTTNHAQTIAVVLANGTMDSINLQPKSRAELPMGSSVDPKRIKVYSSYIKFHDNGAPQSPTMQAQPSSTVTQGATPSGLISLQNTVTPISKESPSV